MNRDSVVAHGVPEFVLPAGVTGFEVEASAGCAFVVVVELQATHAEEEPGY